MVSEFTVIKICFQKKIYWFVGGTLSSDKLYTCRTYDRVFVDETYKALGKIWSISCSRRSCSIIIRIFTNLNTVSAPIIHLWIKHMNRTEYAYIFKKYYIYRFYVRRQLTQETCSVDNLFFTWIEFYTNNDKHVFTFWIAAYLEVLQEGKAIFYDKNSERSKIVLY